MSYNWNSFLELAKELKNGAEDAEIKDARLRTAISRAYYCAFHLARNFLRDVEADQGLTNDGYDHIYVKEKFKDDDNQERRKIGTSLERLKSNRTKADYRDNTINGLERTTSYSLELADEIVEGLKKI